MQIFKFNRIRNRIFIELFGIKFKYTSFNNWGKYNKISDGHVIKIVNKLLGTNIKSVEKKVIYIIGDSHSVFFSGQDFLSYKKLEFGITTGCRSIPIFKNYHLGAVLAYNALKENSQTNTFNKTRYLLNRKYIKKDDIVVLSFGEIDIRVHLLKRAKRNDNGYLNHISLENEIDKILENYIKYIEFLKSYGIKIVVWGVIATQNESVPKDVLLPSLGSETERNYATMIFNQKLEKLSKENNFIFCSIFNKLTDENLNTKTEYYIDGYHLGTKALPLMIEEFLNKKILTVNNRMLKINYDCR